MREAKEEHADALERELEEMGRKSGNPVPHIVRLKALRPNQYIEKHAVMSMTFTGQLEPADAASILRGMLADLSPATKALLGHEEAIIIHVPALPEDDAAP